MVKSIFGVGETGSISSFRESDANATRIGRALDLVLILDNGATNSAGDAVTPSSQAWLSYA